MTKVNEAREILHAFGFPVAQQNEMSALTLLALCSVGPETPWSKSQRHSVTVTKGIMAFIAVEYGRAYAPNTRETFRRQVLHQFVQARLVDYNPDQPDLPTNSPRAHYALTEPALAVIKTYGTQRWDKQMQRFIARHGSLLNVYQRARTGNFVPVRLPDGTELQLSPGQHNVVQAAVIEEFAPRFAPGSTLLYLGDTAKKNLFMDAQALDSLHLAITEHDKLPDVLLYDADRNWLFLVEAVTSHGPMTPKRIVELEAMLTACPAGGVFVSAFPDLTQFRKHLKHIAWETEVWIMEMPDHLIHFNGDRFLGPR